MNNYHNCKFFTVNSDGKVVKVLMGPEKEDKKCLVRAKNEKVLLESVVNFQDKTYAYP
jgi:hypothetical protein